MIDIFDALGWLNAIDDRSYLTGESSRLIEVARMMSREESEVRAILERLRNQARSSDNGLERAELLLNCAAIGKSRGWISTALRDASTAVISCDQDDHRRTASLWILGMLQWEMKQNHDAYKSSATARELFRKRRILFQHFPDEEAWYRNRIREMDIDLIARPEEIRTWLNQFERPSLRPQTDQIIRKVQERVRNETHLNAYALMQDLQEARECSEGFHEAAEVALEFGLALYQIGHTHFAIDLLRNAVRDFYPGFGLYHKQTVARCMLGAMEWMETSSQRQAYTDWTRCLEEFEKLRWWADRDRCPEKEEWYARRCDTLRAALLERVRPPEPLPPGPRTPGPAGTPPDPTAPGGETDLYEELLIKVQRDPGTADRLIEFERKKAPTAGRAEWIRRAIERWLHDNR